jgi:hypothetical protein
MQMLMCGIEHFTAITVKSRGSVRSRRGLGPTMTVRGQHIGISIGMLDKLIWTTIGLKHGGPSKRGLERSPHLPPSNAACGEE